MPMPTVTIGADHAGFALKEDLLGYLRRLGYDVRDAGATKLDRRDDYPDYAFPTARAAVRGKGVGILVCGSGEGVCIAANKVRGSRAVAVSSVREARKAREHNDANVLCLSGWVLSPREARAIAVAFLATPFSGAARHTRRLAKIAAFERGR